MVNQRPNIITEGTIKGSSVNALDGFIPHPVFAGKGGEIALNVEVPISSAGFEVATAADCLSCSYHLLTSSV